MKKTNFVIHNNIHVNYVVVRSQHYFITVPRREGHEAINEMNPSLTQHRRLSIDDEMGKNAISKKNANRSDPSRNRWGHQLCEAGHLAWIPAHAREPLAGDNRQCSSDKGA